MKTIAPQLPTIFGSFAAMLVAFIGLMSGSSPSTCMMKAAAAFMVFAGFGLIIRYALETAGENEPLTGSGLEVIVPGTAVADLLGAHEDEDEDEAA